MVNILFLIQARSGSTRFPNKVLQPFYEGDLLIDFVIKRIKLSSYATSKNIWILTTDNPTDYNFAEYLLSKGYNVFRGNEHNVYDRFASFLKQLSVQPDFFFRVCSDNPFIEPQFINGLIDLASNDIENKAHYYSYCDHNKTPAILTHYGFFCELIRCSTFLDAEQCVVSDYDKEHVTPYFYKYENFPIKLISMPECISNGNYRFTIDTKNDFEIISKVLYELDDKINFSYNETIKIANKNKIIIKQMYDLIERNRK